MGYQLEVKGLCKQIAAKTILKDVSFIARKGDLIVITGPNGAGKTTLLRLLAGLTKQSAGSILWAPPLGKGDFLGYVSHKSMLYDNLTVLENMVFFAKLHGQFAKGRIEERLAEMGLWLYRQELVSVLSRGMQQRLALARTFLLDPQVILYDEPFTGLDTAGQKLLRGILAKKRQRALQLLVTHELGFLAGLAYQELCLEKGRLLRGGVGCA